MNLPKGDSPALHAASRRFKLSARVTPAAREAALRRAWKALDAEHYSVVHPTGEAFAYKPNLCVGCAHSVIRAMADGTLE